MSVPISNVTRRVVLSASGTGPYSFNFEILANTDISVYRDDTLLTLTTDYTVTINTNGTGFVTLTATPTGATQIAIVGDRAIQRTSDFTTGGDLFAATLNDELDSITIFAQQNAEASDRALKAPQTDPTNISMTLPRASSRAGKVLSFDSNGNPAAVDYIGTNRGNWASGTAYNQRDIAKDTTNDNIYQVLTPHTSSGSLPLSSNADFTKWALLVDAAAASSSASAAASSASAASTSASNASTSASNASTSASNASTSASNASSSASAAAADAASAASALAQTLTAYDNFDDRYLGAKSSDPSLDNDGNALLAGALYFNTVLPGMKVYTGSAWVIAYSSGAGLLQVANNLSDVASTATSRTNLGLGTGDSPQFTAVNVGNASDTTVTRASAGVIAVEGSNVLMASNIGASVQAYDAELQAISGLSANGLVTRTSSSTAAARTITGTTNVITVTNGDGVSGNPTLTTGSLVARTDTAQTFTAAQTLNSGNLKLAGSTSGTSTLNASAIAGTTTITLPSQTSTLGYINIPPVGTKTGSYTLATSDVGEYVQVGSGGSITIPDATFAEGDAVSIFNNTSGNITITCTITTAYIAGTDTDKATVSLATRGVATVLFISGTVCVITGNVS
jgi:hypothetical protein